MKFLMNRPDLDLYPLNDGEIEAVDGKSEGRDRLERERADRENADGKDSDSKFTYPDYKPWKDHTQMADTVEEQRVNNSGFLNKGYFESPMVSNEYYSARNLIQMTIFSSTDKCNNVLKELSLHLANGYKTRNEVINKIRYNSNNFKIPPRVTLTASKKEAWLKDLASENVPLVKIAEKIPHGIRNKILIDSICNKNVPTSRALWFTKCVLYGELLTLRRKHLIKHHDERKGEDRVQTPNNPNTTQNSNYNQTLPNNNSSIDTKFEVQWLQEWTQQVIDYIYKLSKDFSTVPSPEKKQNLMGKLNYLISYILTLYVENLLDKTFFLSLILKFFKQGLPLNYDLNELLNSLAWVNDFQMNFGQKLISLTLIKVFWNDFLKFEFLCKEMNQVLLLNYYFISKLPSMKKFIPDSLKSMILEMISNQIVFLLKFNPNIFIIPNYWILINDILFKILLKVDDDEKDEILKQFDLIKYRNESLMLNCEVSDTDSTNRGKNEEEEKHQEYQNSPGVKMNQTAEELFQTSPVKSQNSEIRSPIKNSHNNSPLNLPGQEISSNVYINRNHDDILKIIQQLDSLNLTQDLANQLKPSTPNWKIKLRLVLFWCITSYRNIDSSEGILIICNFIKRMVLLSLKVRKMKFEFENEVLEFIYTTVDENSTKTINYNLYVLINELYQLKILTIASYIRKLIASGMFYISKDNENDEVRQKLMNEDSYGTGELFNSSSTSSLTLQISIHLNILQNLPVLNNKQCDNILKKWTRSGYNFQEKFDQGKRILKIELIDKLISNNFDSEFLVNINYINDLNVGLKFLLVNWITNELKVTINLSPKLIHINPEIITNLYNFYSICDNLTVFFKVFVKYILRNEGGVIIFYMDSLYFISRLILKHFKLIKFIEVEAGLELLKLLITNYNDLKTREFDYFKFDEVWKFIKKEMDELDEKNDKSEQTEGHENHQIDQTFQSPINPLPPSMNSTLNFLLSDTQFLSNSEIMDINETLDITANDFKFLLNLLFMETFKDDHEILVVKLIINQKNEGDSQIGDFLKDIEASETTKLCRFLKKLLTYEILNLNDMIKLLADYRDLNSILYQVVIEAQDQIMLDLIREEYRIKYPRQFCTMIVRLVREEGEKIASGPFLSYFQHLIIFSPKLFLDTVLTNLSEDKCLEIVNKLTQNNEIHSLKDFENSVDIDEFNLPFYQIMLRLLCEREVQYHENGQDLGINENTDQFMRDINENGGENNETNNQIDNEINNQIQNNNHHQINQQHSNLTSLKHFISILLDNLKIEFSPYNSYFGELFIYLNWNCKLFIMKTLEERFFNCKFEDNLITLENKNGFNLFPILCDYFRKFSTSTSSYKLESDLNFYKNLSTFLKNLLKVINSTDIANVDCISILLRILIIHKSSLPKLILKFDFDFEVLKNLIVLLKSNCLSIMNEKLYILLYDLLLILKTSIIEQMSLNLDEIDINYDDTEREGRNNSNPSNSVTSISNPPLSVPSSTFTNSPSSNYSSTSISLLSSIFTLPPPHNENPFNSNDHSKIQCVLTLTDDELQRGGDINIVNDNNLVLFKARNDSLSNFGIIGSTNSMGTSTPFKLKSFEVVEDTSTSLNDGCINLQLFDSYITRENPP